MTTDLQVRKRISLNHNSSILNERKKLTTNPTEAILKVHRGVLYITTNPPLRCAVGLP